LGRFFNSFVKIGFGGLKKNENLATLLWTNVG
jgi:hypothetical protein